jgi:hypothetical protein
MQLDNELALPKVLCCGGLPPAESETFEKQVLEFLDGKTHGEELFHVLYDHVLDEPIPERMRALFRAGGAD